MVPQLFDVQTSLVLIAVLAVAAYLARRQHRKLRESMRTHLVSWELISFLLWGVCIMVLLQLLARLPKYL